MSNIKFQWTVTSPDNFTRTIPEMIDKEGRFRMKNLGSDLIKGLASVNNWDEKEVQKQLEAYVGLQNADMAQALVALLQQYDKLMSAAPAPAPAPATPAPEPERTPVPQVAAPAQAPAVEPERTPARRGGKAAPAPAATPATEAAPAAAIDPVVLTTIVQTAVAEALKPLAAELSSLRTMVEAVTKSQAHHTQVDNLDKTVRLLTALMLFVGENELGVPRPQLAKMALDDIGALNEFLGGKAKAG